MASSNCFKNLKCFSLFNKNQNNENNETTQPQPTNTNNDQTNDGELID